MRPEPLLDILRRQMEERRKYQFVQLKKKKEQQEMVLRNRKRLGAKQ
jgi:hypothetical protein